MALLPGWATGRRVAALRRTVRRLAATTLPGWRWTEPDNLQGLTVELSAMTARLRDRLDELTEERDRAGHLLALLHFAHRSVLPGRLQHDHAVDRRFDAHLADVALRVAPGVLGAIALDLERLQIGGIRPALQIERAAQLLELRPRLVERQLVLFRGNRRGHLVLEHLEIRAFDGVLGRLHLRLVVRPGGELLAALLVDLLDEIAVLRLAVVRGLDLRLAVEFDEEIAAFHRGARLDQADDDERSGARTG